VAASDIPETARTAKELRMPTKHSHPREIDADTEVDERRIQPRRAILIKADVKFPGRAVMKAQAVDLSRGGLGLQSPIAVDIDQEVAVNLPLDIFGEQRTMALTGRVRYCSRQPDQHYRIGLQFVNLNADAIAFVSAVCA
jgi:c-di-GMP-binding flagellar brake protein YcgR